MKNAVVVVIVFVVIVVDVVSLPLASDTQGFLTCGT